MRINFLRKKVPIICSICLILTLLFSCSDTNRSGNYSTLNAEVDTVGGFDNTFVNPGLTGTTTRMSKNPKVTTNPEPASMPVNPVTDAAGYYNYTETAPAFAGGTDALQLYFDNNLTYPQDAIDNNVEGTVMVKFTIDDDGTVKNVTTTGRKLGFGIEDEAIRVVRSMSAWIPGTVNSKNVKSWYTLPVAFRLE